jgi:hypothetical protein
MGYFFMLKKPPKVYNHPMGEKFAQSGHPAYVRSVLSYFRWIHLSFRYSFLNVYFSSFDSLVR